MSTLKKRLVAPFEAYRAQWDGPWAQKLGLDILEQDFGASVRVLAQAIIDIGLASITDIRAYFLSHPTPTFNEGNFSVSRVKASLIVLLTHGLCAAHVTKTLPTVHGQSTATLLSGTLASQVALAAGIQGAIPAHTQSGGDKPSRAMASGSASAFGHDYGQGIVELDVEPFQVDLEDVDGELAGLKPRKKGSSKSATSGRTSKAEAVNRPSAGAKKEAPMSIPLISSSAAGGEDPVGTEYGQEKYRIDLPKILLRARFPQFMAVTKRQFGDAGASIAQSLLQHGPWRRSATLNDAAHILAREAAEKRAAESGLPLPSKDTSFLPPPPAAAGLKRRRSSSAESTFSASGVSEDQTAIVSDVTSEEIAQAYQEVLSVWNRMVEAQYLIPAEGVGAYGLPRAVRASDALRYDPQLWLKMGISLDSKDNGRGSKRPRTEVVIGTEADEGPHDGGAGHENIVIWRFGWEAAMRRMRNDLVLRYVKSMTAGGDANVDAARRVVDVIMRRSDATEIGYNAARSASVSVEAIAQVMQTNKHTSPGARGPSPAGILRPGTPNVPLTPAQINTILATLSRLPTAPIVEVSALSQPSDMKQYYVDYTAVLTLLQLRTIENSIQEKFDVNAARVVRLLLERGALDEKNISDLIMLPQKDARTAVFSLLASGVVSIQEVPRRPDHHPQFTFFLFEAKFDHLLHTLAEWSHQASLNLRRRLRMEIARFKAAERANADGTMQLPDAVRRSVMAFADVDPDTEEIDEADVNETALVLMEGATERLRAGILRVDTTLALMRDLHRSDVDYVTPEDIDRVALSIAKDALAKTRH